MYDGSVALDGVGSDHDQVGVSNGDAPGPVAYPASLDPRAAQLGGQRPPLPAGLALEHDNLSGSARRVERS